MRIEEMVFNGNFHVYHVVRTVWMQGKGATVICRHDMYSLFKQVREELAQDDYKSQTDALLGHDRWVKRLRENLRKERDVCT